MINAYDIARIRFRLESDWERFADRFIPQYENSTIWCIKNKEAQREGLREYEINLLRIRNHLHSFTLHRNYRECTREEIAENKLIRLLRLLKRRPELSEIILRNVN